MANQNEEGKSMVVMDEPTVVVTNEQVVTAAEDQVPSTGEPTAVANESAGDATKKMPMVKERLEIRKKAGLKIDPETALINFIWGDISDPYGLYPDDREHGSCVGRVYFARSPADNIWVADQDLPAATSDALRKRRHKNGIPIALIDQAIDILAGVSPKTPREIDALAWLRELVRMEPDRSW